MTRDQIAAMARQAGFSHPAIEDKTDYFKLDAFAQLVAAHEREEMAKLCDKMALDAPFVEEQSACEDCAAAIRARGAHADAS